jgi:hypothetical protein
VTPAWPGGYVVAPAPAWPGHDEVILTTADGARLCNSRACAQAGRAAAVIVTYGVLNDPGAGYHSREALWRESWHQPIPMCGACWDSSRQVAARYRPGLVVIDATGMAGPAAAAQSSGGRQ